MVDREELNVERNSRQRWLVWVTVAAYVLIGVEIIVMISPFALYFYSVYAPLLGVLSSSPRFAWTTEFFLPHLVFPDNVLIMAVSYLQVLLVVGLALFLAAAVPLYYGRFTKKGVVKGGFYGRIRHPQYLFLAISGFGLLLYWPRFIILIMYVSMLFGYYLLAKNEEWWMKNEQPHAYGAYMARTSMFLPGEPGGRIYATLLGWIRPKWLGLIACYFLVLAVAIPVAVAVRSYTVRSLPLIQAGSMAVLPVFPRPAAEITELYEAVRTAEKTRGFFAGQGLQANLAYVMPGDFFLLALVSDADRRFSDDMIERFPEILEWHQHRFSGGLGRFFRIFYNFFRTWASVETDYGIERLVFMRVRDAEGRLLPRERLFAMSARREPVLLVDVDADTHEILTVVNASGEHKWGTVPMPTF